MAELISAKDLPATEAEEVDVLCVDNGELKRKQAKGLGGAGSYIIKVTADEFAIEDTAGTITIALSESYDNFAPILYNGGTLILDITEPLIVKLGAPSAGTASYAQLISWMLIEGAFQGSANVVGGNATVTAAGTWTPPTE